MLKYSKSALGLLTNQYRSVLRKCALLNLGLFALAMPAQAEISEITADNLNTLTSPKVEWEGPVTEIPLTEQFIIVDQDDGEQYYTYNYTNVDDYDETDQGVSGDFTEADVTNKVFTGFNATADDFGAVYIEGENASIFDITSDFVKNSVEDAATAATHAATSGIFNMDVIGDITGDFVDNSVNYETSIYTAGGAAIQNYGDAGSISGNFVDNSASATNGLALGGAILNLSGVVELDTQDTGTTSHIDSISANFIGNTVEDSTLVAGGAILNAANVSDTDVVLGGITGDFVANYGLTEGTALGGAIVNMTDVSIETANSTIGTVTGDFIGNSVEGDTNAFGGAVYNALGGNNTSAVVSITALNGNFTQNYAFSDTGNALGGAIYNSNPLQTTPIAVPFEPAANTTSTDSSASIETIAGNFSQNYAKSTSGDAFGGAIYNEAYESSVADTAVINSVSGEFSGNYAMSESGNAAGGAIYNTATIGEVTAPVADEETTASGIVNSSFMENYAQSSEGTAFGGAIATSQNLTLTAQDGFESVISGNYVEDADGKREEAITAFKVAETDEAPTLTFTALTDGSFTIDDKITGVDGYKVAFNGDQTGIVNLNNAIATNYTFSNGEVEYSGDQMGVDVSVENVTLKLGDVAALTADNLTLNNATLDVINDTIDSVVLGSINTTEGATGNLAIDIDLEQNVADTFTVSSESAGTYNFKDMNVLGLPAEEGAFEVEIFKATEGASIAGLVMNTYDAIYSNMDQITLEQGTGDKIGYLTYEYTKGEYTLNDAVAFEDGDRQYAMSADEDIVEDLGAMGGENSTLSIAGNGYAINGNGFEGITVGDGQTLELNDIQDMNGFDPAAVAIEEGGTANIIGSTFSDNGSDVVNDGALNLSGDNIFNDKIEGNGTMNISEGTSIFNDNVDQGIIIVGEEQTPQAKATDAVMDIGTNTVTADDISFINGSTLALTVNSADEYGSVIAQNITVETGAKLQATLAQGIIQTQPVTLQLLSAENTDFNNFADSFDNQMYKFEKVDNNGAYKISLAKTAEQVSAENGGTRNNQVTARAWADGGLFPNAADQALANKISATAQNNPQELNRNLTALAPNDAPVVQNTTIVLQNHLYDAIDKHLRGESLGRRNGRASGDMYDDMEIWAAGYLGHNKLQNRSGFYGFKSDTTGGIIALEGKSSMHTKMGVGYQYDYTKVDAFSRDTKVNTHSGFIYAEYKPSAWFFDATASYGYSTYKDKKSAFGNEYRGKYHADLYGLQGLMGYEHIGQYATFTPQAGLRYSYIKRHGYNDNAGQDVSGKDMDFFTGVLGFKLGKDLYYNMNCNVMRPEIYLGITYDFVSDRDNAIVNLGNGSSYAINGKRLDRMGYEMGAGVTAELNDKWTGSLSYLGDLRNHYQNHSGMLTLSYAF
ncbi:MAG: autotransporter domain-containing protein [Alphaproteobacteria bacterium]|nr:autotransporter domain-containing protein [Alphaproteobacteria bacterium]